MDAHGMFTHVWAVHADFNVQIVLKYLIMSETKDNKLLEIPMCVTIACK